MDSMRKCEVSVTATFAVDRVNVEGRRDFSGAGNMDEVASTCAGAISTVLEAFHRTLTEHAPAATKNSEEIRELSALHVLFVALYNYLRKTGISIVEKGMEDILARLRDMAEKKNGESGAPAD